MRLLREAPTTTQRSINHGASLTSQLPAQHCKRQYRWHRVLSYPRDAQESTIKLTAAATRQALSQQLATSGTPYEVKWVVESSIHQLEPDQLALAAHRCVHTEGHHTIHGSMYHPYENISTGTAARGTMAWLAALSAACWQCPSQSYISIMLIASRTSQPSKRINEAHDAAACRLASCTASQDTPEVAASLGQRALQMLSTFRPRDMSLLLHSLAGCRVHGPWVATLLEEVAAWGLGLHTRWMDEFRPKVSELLGSVLGNMALGSASLLLVVWAWLGTWLQLPASQVLLILPGSSLCSA
jgi:hypothetical protein